MSSHNNGTATESSGGNSKIAIAGTILVIILTLSFAFFWSGNIAYGLIVLAIPSFSIIVSTCCYMTNQSDEQDSEEYEADFPNDDNTQSRLPDRPPSYRGTWRRSFIKRLRSARQVFSDPEKAEENSPNSESSNPEQTPVNFPVILSDRISDGVQDAPTNENTLLKFPVVPKDSLPTYDEAVDIMKSIEQLNRIIDDDDGSSS